MFKSSSLEALPRVALRICWRMSRRLVCLRSHRSSSPARSKNYSPTMVRFLRFDPLASPFPYLPSRLRRFQDFLRMWTAVKSFIRIPERDFVETLLYMRNFNSTKSSENSQAKSINSLTKFDQILSLEAHANILESKDWFFSNISHENDRSKAIISSISNGI